MGNLSWQHILVYTMVVYRYNRQYNYKRLDRWSFYIYYSIHMVMDYMDQFQLEL